jgi:hypothetical protein
LSINKIKEALWLKLHSFLSKRYMTNKRFNLYKREQQAAASVRYEVLLKRIRDLEKTHHKLKS